MNQNVLINCRKDQSYFLLSIFTETTNLLASYLELLSVIRSKSRFRENIPPCPQSDHYCLTS